MKWKLISSKSVFESPYISLFSNTYELPNGEIKGGYYHLARPDYVLILAVSNKGRLVIEKQYRRGVDDYVYELPAGWIEKGENPLDSAVREFKEETGFKGSGEIIATMFAQPGFSSMKAYVAFLQFDETAQEKANPSEDENIKFELKTIDEVKSMIKNEQIKDMGFLSAFSIYLTKNL